MPKISKRLEKTRIQPIRKNNTLVKYSPNFNNITRKKSSIKQSTTKQSTTKQSSIKKSSKYDNEKKLINLFKNKINKTIKTKLTKQNNNIINTIPDKTSDNWQEFIEIFSENKHIYEKTIGSPNSVELYRISQIINIPIGFLRSLTSDFMSNFRNDTPSLVTSTIHNSCLNNYKQNSICYCCGKSMFPGNMACDHLIPIMSMLLIVDNKSINNNLFYTHKKCNEKKSNMDIFTFYNLAGTNFFNSSSSSSTQNECKTIISSYLKNIHFRKYEDIIERYDRLNRIEKHLHNIYDEIDLLSKTGQQALIVDAFTMLNETNPSLIVPMQVIAEGKKSKKLKKHKLKRNKFRKSKKIKNILRKNIIDNK
tara:strand:- start:601 stop:1695 length:1095 start_codon:yes stop_codon:yes gene_type:complete